MVLGRTRIAEATVGLCAFILLVAHVGIQAAVQEREVEAAGSGATEQEAVFAALGNAVGMVNGLNIESRQWLAAIERHVASEEGDSYMFEEASSLDIATLTKGTISSYEVISTAPKTRGGHEARVRATIAVFERGRDADRKRIAVLPLRGRDSYAIDGARIAPLAVTDLVEQAIVNELVDSRRFTVLDRKYMASVDIELKLLDSGDVPVSELARLGQTLTADYVLVGTVENIDGRTTKRRMRTRDVEARMLNVDAQLSYRVVDPATKQVKFSRTETMTFGDRELSAVGASLPMSDVATIAVGAAKIIGRKVGTTVTEAVYPIVVTAVTSNGVVLGQGGESMVAGLVFDLFRLGDRMIDPYTKESIGRIEEWAGTVEVTRATNKQSYAKFVEGSDIDPRSNFAPRAFIARRKEHATGVASVRERVERTRQAREKRDKQQEALW